MPRPVHPTPGLVFSCPQCGSSRDIWAREWKQGGIRTTEEDRVVCYNCDHEFGTPDVRRDRGESPAIAATTEAGP